MLSLAAKTHWKMAIKAVSKAVKVTFQDMIQIIKSRKYHNKVIDNLERKRKFFELEKTLWE